MAVTGAGGFIGGHLVGRLLADGHGVRASDIKPLAQWFQVHPAAHNIRADVATMNGAMLALWKTDACFNLAANMGGMGFIETHKLDCMLNVLSTTYPLLAARDLGLAAFVQASSACVYPVGRQTPGLDDYKLRESMAYPAMPEAGYGEEKLFGERMCQIMSGESRLRTGVVRLHNVYGKHSAWDGIRAKAPAAICRKVAEAVLSNRRVIDIWGTGNQLRSFMYVDDCVQGFVRIMDVTPEGSCGPVNLGSEEMVSINGLVDVAEIIAFGSAGILERRYNASAPTGVGGRCSDNTLLRSMLSWEPATPLRDGMSATYEWVLSQVRSQHANSGGHHGTGTVPCDHMGIHPAKPH